MRQVSSAGRVATETHGTAATVVASSGTGSGAKSIAGCYPFFFDAAVDAAGGTTRGRLDANACRDVASP